MSDLMARIVKYTPSGGRTVQVHVSGLEVRINNKQQLQALIQARGESIRTATANVEMTSANPPDGGFHSMEKSWTNQPAPQ